MFSEKVQWGLNNDVNTFFLALNFPVKDGFHASGYKVLICNHLACFFRYLIGKFKVISYFKMLCVLIIPSGQLNQLFKWAKAKSETPRKYTQSVRKSYIDVFCSHLTKVTHWNKIKTIHLLKIYFKQSYNFGMKSLKRFWSNYERNIGIVY